ncbi:EF-hand domain-containing protein [Durusdinium trenchii]|uniref:EF-hand domain-containing protein n=1 Tax=Durusdinium trenchii TaxID=1381693 RepID=A0ABP0P7V1_9DINO
MASGGAVENVFGDASFLRIFRLMRLTRLLRMARLIRMVPELLIMVKAVASAARSVGFTLILLGICLYVYAIVFRLLFDQTTAGNEYFPSVLMAMHKLFMHGTLLDSVSEMMTELLKESWIGFILGYFFIISPPWLNSSSLMSAITVMNMLIGVLCEVITAVADAEKEALQVSWTTEVLQQCLTAGADTNNDGCIDLDEFQHMIENPQVRSVLREADVDAATLINFADVLFEGEGKKLAKIGDELLTKIPFSEFMTRTLKLRGSNTATVKDLVDLVDLRKWMSKELLALRKLSRMSMASMAMPTAMPYSVNLPFEYVLHV